MIRKFELHKYCSIVPTNVGQTVPYSAYVEHEHGITEELTRKLFE